MFRSSAPRLAVALVGLGLAPQGAQDTKRDPLSLVPADSLLVVELDGPGKLSKVFARTQLGKLFRGPEFRSMLGDLERRYVSVMGDFLAERDLDPADIVRGVERYEGRVILAASMDFSKIAPAAPPPMSVAIIVAPEGKVNLPGVAKKYAEIVEAREDADLGRVEVDGHGFRVADSNGIGWSLPKMLGGNLVMFAGSDIEATIRAALDSDKPELPAARARAPISARFSFSAIGSMFHEVMKRTGTPGADELPAIVEELGLARMRDMHFELRPAGRYVLGDTRIDFGTSDSVLLAALSAKTKPALLDLVPYQSDGWWVSTIDLPALYKLFPKVAGRLENATGLSAEALEKVIEGYLKVRLDEDLLAHMGREMISVGIGSIGDGGSEDPLEQAGIAGQCYGVALRDSKSFAKGFERMLRVRALHVGRKSEDYRGFQVSSVKFLGLVKVFYAITDRVFLVGAGDAGGKTLLSVLDEIADRAEGKAKPGMPKALSERIAQAGIDDWHGASYADLTPLLDELEGVFRQDFAREFDAQGLEMGEEALEILEAFAKVFALVAELLETYDLTKVVSVSTTKGSVLTQRIIW